MNDISLLVTIIKIITIIKILKPLQINIIQILFLSNTTIIGTVESNGAFEYGTSEEYRRSYPTD